MFHFFFQFSRKVQNYYSTPWEFFSSVLADGLSLEFERQQISSSLQDFSQYSCRSPQYCSLDCLHSSSYFQVPKSFYQTLVSVPRPTMTIGIAVTFMFHREVQLLILFFFFSLSFNFTQWSTETAKSTTLQKKKKSNKQTNSKQTNKQTKNKQKSLFFVCLFVCLLIVCLFVAFFFFLLIIIRSGPFVCQNPKEVCVSHYPGQILGCAYTICLYGQISISCTIPNGSPFSPSRV